jgi:hypothetical protein
MVQILTKTHIRKLPIYNWQNLNSFMQVKNNIFGYLNQKKKSYDLQYHLNRLDTVKLGPTATFEIIEPKSLQKIGYCFEFAYVTTL